MCVGYLSIVCGALLWWFGLTWLIDKVRNKFDNSFEKWFATAGSSDWISAMSFVDSKDSDDDPSASAGESEVIKDS